MGVTSWDCGLCGTGNVTNSISSEGAWLQWSQRHVQPIVHPRQPCWYPHCPPAALWLQWPHLGYFGLSFLLEKYPVFTHWSLQPIILMVHSQVCKLFELRIWFLFQKWPFYKSLDVQNTLPVNLNGPVWAPWQEAVLNQAKIRHFGLMCLKGMSPTIVLDQ